MTSNSNTPSPSRDIGGTVIYNDLPYSLFIIDENLEVEETKFRGLREPRYKGFDDDKVSGYLRDLRDLRDDVWTSPLSSITPTLSLTRSVPTF